MSIDNGILSRDDVFREALNHFSERKRLMLFTDVDFTNRDAVIAYAQYLAKKFPHTVQYVVKYPTRTTYNVTMNSVRARTMGAEVVWDSSENKVPQ